MKEWIKTNLGLLFILIITVIYLFCVLGITDLSAYHDLKLNEKGDFLAGVFSPLAFLWLVYGYLQQGQELKLNTQALTMQAEELAISNTSLKKQVEEMEKSVKAQQDMFELAEKQYNDSMVEKSEASKPKLTFISQKFNETRNYSFNGSMDYEFKISIKISNISIKDIVITSNFWYVTISPNGHYDNNTTVNITRLDVGKEVNLIFYLKGTNLVPFKNNTITLKYSDFNSNQYDETYNLNLKDSKFIEFIKYTQSH